MFDHDDYIEEEEERRGNRQGGGGGLFLKVLGGLLILPAIPAGAIQFYVTFMKGRLRLSVISVIVAIETILLLPIAMANSLPVAFSALFSGDISVFSKGYWIWGTLIGIWAAWGFTAFCVMRFKKRPSSLAMEGWMYHFKYRPTPWEYFAKKFLQKKLENGEAYSTDGAPVGLLEAPVDKRVPEIDDDAKNLRKTDTQIVYRSYKDAVRQTIITGQTGSGKSVAMLSLMYNDILNGIPLTVVDFKKSADVLYFLSKWAKENGRDFYYFTNGDGGENEFYGEQSTYDPLATGDQTSKADFILNLREWDAAADVYKQRTQEILQGVLYALMNVPHNEAPDIHWNSGNLRQLIDSLDVDSQGGHNMYDLASYLERQRHSGAITNNTDILRIDSFISNYKEMTNPKSSTGKALKEQVVGIRTVISKLVMSSYGKWLMNDPRYRHIDLLKLSQDKENAPIVLFAFSSQDEPDFAKSMGQVIMSDLNRVSAIKTGMNNKDLFGVYIDEFQTLNPKFIADLLAKARSAGFFMTIASQSLEQIAVAATDNPEPTIQAILDVCGNYLFLKGAKQDSAERMAKIMGETKHIARRVMTNSNSSIFQLQIFNARKGMTNKEVKDDWVVSPAAFQSLRDAEATNHEFSEAYFISTYEDAKTGNKENAAQRVRIIAQKDILPGPSQEFLDFIAEKTKADARKGTQHTVDVDQPASDLDLDQAFEAMDNVSPAPTQTEAYSEDYIPDDYNPQDDFESIPVDQQTIVSDPTPELPPMTRAQAKPAPHPVATQPAPVKSAPAKAPAKPLPRMSASQPVSKPTSAPVNSPLVSKPTLSTKDTSAPVQKPKADGFVPRPVPAHIAKQQASAPERPGVPVDQLIAMQEAKTKKTMTTFEKLQLKQKQEAQAKKAKKLQERASSDVTKMSHSIEPVQDKPKKPVKLPKL